MRDNNTFSDHEAEHFQMAKSGHSNGLINETMTAAQITAAAALGAASGGLPQGNVSTYQASDTGALYTYPGNGVSISTVGGSVGTFATSAALQSAYPAGTQGRTAQVGRAKPYVTYFDNGTSWSRDTKRTWRTSTYFTCHNNNNLDGNSGAAATPCVNLIKSIAGTVTSGGGNATATQGNTSLTVGSGASSITSPAGKIIVDSVNNVIGVISSVTNDTTIVLAGGGANMTYTGAWSWGTMLTDHNAMQCHKVQRRAGRFRLKLTNGNPGTTNLAWTLSGYTEVPAKNVANATGSIQITGNAVAGTGTSFASGDVGKWLYATINNVQLLIGKIITFSSTTSVTIDQNYNNVTVPASTVFAVADPIYLQWRFGGQPTYSVPAGGGATWYTDWMGWPLEVGDIIAHKSYHTAGGGQLVITQFGSPVTTTASTLSLSVTNTFDSVLDNQGSDVSASPRMKTPWAAAASSAHWKPSITETDTFEDNRNPTVDVHGDSIAAGGNIYHYPSYLNQYLPTVGIAYQNLAIPGTSPDYYPLQAKLRMAMAVGDIVISEHGRNSSNTTSHAYYWKILKEMGYRAIIAILPTDITNNTNTAITSDSIPIRNLIRDNIGAVDGPNTSWDVHGYIQPTGALSVASVTVSVNTSSTAVVGIGTNFTSADVGKIISDLNGYELGRISAFTDATHVTLSTNAAIPGGGSGAYTTRYSIGGLYKGVPVPGVTVTVTSGSNSLSFGGTGYVSTLDGFIVTDQNGVFIGYISTGGATLTANSPMSYSGQLYLLPTGKTTNDGTHPNDWGNIDIAAYLTSINAVNDLL